MESCSSESDVGHLSPLVFIIIHASKRRSLMSGVAHLVGCGSLQMPRMTHLSPYSSMARPRYPFRAYIS